MPKQIEQYAFFMSIDELERLIQMTEDSLELDRQALKNDYDDPEEYTAIEKDMVDVQQIRDELINVRDVVGPTTHTV